MCRSCHARSSTVPRDRRAHLVYREPWGWESPPDCLPSREAAEFLRDATNALSPAAAERRVWSITDCTDENCGARR